MSPESGSRFDDVIDFHLLDAASKASFGAVDGARRAQRWYRRRREEIRAWRTANPSTFDQVAVIVLDQIAVIVLAAVLECLAAWINNRRS